MRRSVKLGFLAVLTAVLCIACTGCIKLTETVTVSADKSMDFTIDEGINLEKYASFSTMYGNETTKDEVAEEIEGGVDSESYDGWTVEKYNDGTYAGAKMTYHIANIEDVTTTEGTAEEWGGLSLNDTYTTSSDSATGISDMTNVTFFHYDPDKKVYTLKISSGGSSSASETSAQMMSDMFDELSFTVNLPEPAISNNATEVTNGGKTLVWKYTSDTVGKMDSVEVSFSLESSGTTVAPIVGGIVVVLVIIAVIAIVVVARRKKAAAPASEAGKSADAETKGELQEAKVIEAADEPKAADEPQDAAGAEAGAEVEDAEAVKAE